MLTVSDLSKEYPNGVKALNQVSLSCPVGVYGLLGQNGAGKSTLMRTIATLQDADSGRATLGELNLLKDHHKARKLIGYLPQEMGVYPRMTALETLQYFANLKGLVDVDLKRELDRVNLKSEAHQRLDSFSGGMKQRFGIAVAFLGNPKLVIVDEPTAGLDPFERRRFQHLLAEAAQNCILLLSSHIVEDIADLAGKMAILHRGQVLAEDSPSHLISAMAKKVWTREIDFHDLSQFKENHHVLSWRPRSESHLVRVYSPESPGPEYQSAEPDLEDYYAWIVSQND